MDIQRLLTSLSTRIIIQFAFVVIGALLLVALNFESREREERREPLLIRSALAAFQILRFTPIKRPCASNR